MRQSSSLLAFCKLLAVCLSFMSADTLCASDYVYAYMPTYQSYTTLGSGSIDKVKFNYNSESLAGGTEAYAYDKIVCGVFARNATTGTITVRVKKGSGYFVNGNSGKVFILSGDGDIYATSFSISNSTTSYVTATIPNLGDFTGTKNFEVFLITSDQVYKQYAGEITVTGSESVLPPTVQVDDATDITSTTATLKGKINPNGSKTTYYFKYGTTSSMTESTATGTVSASSGEVSKSVAVTGLQPDTHYYFQLFAFNEGGTAKSGTNDFYTEESNSAPTTPTNYSPKEGVVLSASSGTLSWECSDPNGDVLTYEVYMGKTESSMSRVYSGTKSSYTYSNLTPGIYYYWYVTASDGETKVTGATISFQTASDNNAPDNPTSPSPSDGATGVSTSGTLSWSCSDADGDVLTYKVYLGTSTGNMSLLGTVSSKSISYSGLDYSTKYYWAVSASDAESSTRSEDWSFTTKSAPTEDASLQIVGGTYFGTTELTKGKSYTFSVKVKNNSSSSWYGAFYLKDGSSNVLDWRSTIGAGETVELSKSYTPTSAGTKTLTLYYQTNVSGSGQVVEGGTNPFTVSVVVPTTPLSTPSNASFTATNATTTGFTAKWAAVQDATKYDIQVAQASQAWTTIAYSGTTAATSLNVTGLKPGCQYLFRVRARNDSQESEWSDALKTAIETLHASSASADLKIVLENCIKDETVTVGVPAIYNAYVKNNSSEDWTGAFYLKEGTTLIADWQNRTIAGTSAILLDCKYVPGIAGNRPLTLYYQTDGTGDGIIVPQGSCQNPFVVSVAAAATVDENLLTLKGALTCSSDNMKMGESATLYAKIENKGGSTWSGSVYFTDNGTALASQTVSLASGGTQTIYCTTWTPTVAGPHYIKLMCEKSNTTDEGAYVLDSEDYQNGLTVYVANATATTMPAQVNFVHVTDDVVPKTVTEGTDVYYFFRVTDSNNQPVSGVKAKFQCNTNYASKLPYTTDASDAQGIICMHLSTDGSDADVTRGETLTLSSPVLSDESGNTIERLNNSNTTISLKVKDGGIFENVKKVSVEITPSVGAKVGEDNVASIGAEFSMPFTFNYTYDDNENLSSIGYDREYSIKAEASATLLGCFDTSVSGSVGRKNSVGLNLNKPVKSYSYQLIQWLLHTSLFSSPGHLLAAQILEEWLDSKSKSNYFSDCINSSTESDYFGWSLGGKLNILKAFPSMKGNLLKSTSLPNFSFSTMKLSGSAEFKYEYDKQTYDATKGVTTYGDARSLNYKLGGSIGFDLGSWSYSAKHPWWQSAVITKAYNKVVDKIVPKNLSATTSFIYSINEEEMYTTADKTVLDQISCKTSYSTCWELTNKGWNICKDWLPVDASLKQTNTYTNKLSSKGNWAAYFQKMSNNSVYYRAKAGTIYPIMTGTSIVGAPLAHYNMWTQGFSSALTLFDDGDVESYNLSTSLKVEQQNSSKAEFGVKVDLLSEIPCLKFNVGLKVAAKADYYPSESYYSFVDKRFMPVALRPAESLSNLIEKMTESVQSQMKNLFTNDERKEIESIWEKKSAKVGAGSVAAQPQPVYLTTEGLRQSTGGSTAWVSKRALRRHPTLAAKDQTDISTFSFAINDGETSFDANTDFCLVDFYPAGDLLAITDLGDTLFVVSDVARLTAVNGNDTLSTSPLGTFKLDTYVGKDDLTPFGFSQDQPLDLYYLEDGGECWHYVGPAGTRANIKELGSYAMATSIRDDVLAPTIAATLNRNTGRIRLNITDNIGISLGTLQVYVNGKLQNVAAIDESNFIMQVDYDDLQDMFTLYVTIKDLSGNEARLFQMYDYDAATGIAQTVDKDDRLTVKADGKNVRISGAEANVDVTVFSVSGDIVKRGTTDADGKADLSLGNAPAGVYVITLSNGVSKKIMIK